MAVTFFPVRHHSPACAWHLSKLLCEKKPDCVLIEGPDEANALLPHLGDERNKAPFAVYFSFARGEERVGAYYPLLDYSPELVALRYAHRNGVFCRFIDLPFPAMRGPADPSGQPEEEEGAPSGKSGAWYDDWYLRRSEFIRLLSKKMNCRNEEELWERLFETAGLFLSDEAFVRGVRAFCDSARQFYPDDLLVLEKHREREAWMSQRIREARHSYRNIVAVTGGFHTSALEESLSGESLSAGPAAPEQAGAWLIRYSFAESDRLQGYSSGMPHPAFYQDIFERLSAGEDAALVYEQAVTRFLAKIGSALRKNREQIFLADEIAARSQAAGLGALRDKPCPGVYELHDALLSSYFKDASPMSVTVMREVANTVLRGDLVGSVRSGAAEIPLLTDFRTLCRKYRIDLSTTKENERTLDILAKKEHREESVFLRRTDHLRAGFCSLKKGPDFAARDSSRVREIWSCAYGASVESSLIEASRMGSTVAEAVRYSLMKAVRETASAAGITKILIDAAAMDMTSVFPALSAKATQAAATDGDLFSVAEAVANLLFLEDASRLLSLPDTTLPARLLGVLYTRACAMVTLFATNEEAQQDRMVRVLLDLYTCSGREGLDRDILTESLSHLLARTAPPVPPAIEGAALGLLFTAGTVGAAEVLVRARYWLYGSAEVLKMAGRFLQGLFRTAWDIFFIDPVFLDGISRIVKTLEGDDFLALLPDLRLAFTSFPPDAIDRIAAMVAKETGGSASDILRRNALPEVFIALGIDLDRYASEMLTAPG